MQEKQPTQYQLALKAKMEDAPKLLKIPKSECPDTWIRLGRHKWPKSWSDIEEPVVLLERCTDTHLPDYCREDNLRNFCWDLDGKKYQVGNVSLFIEKRIMLVGKCG